jgi:predicted RNase H-like nuclease
MEFLSLIELFLLLVTFLVILKYEGGMIHLAPLLCLVAVFFLERLQKRMKEEEAAKKRLLKSKLEDYKKEDLKGKSRGD